MCLQMDTLINFLCGRSNDEESFNHCAVVVQNKLHKAPQILEWTAFGPRVRDYDEHFVVSPAQAIYLRQIIAKDIAPMDPEDRETLCDQHCTRAQSQSALVCCASSLWDACQGIDPAVKCVVDLWSGTGFLSPAESEEYMQHIKIQVWGDFNCHSCCSCLLRPMVGVYFERWSECILSMACATMATPIPTHYTKSYQHARSRNCTTIYPHRQHHVPMPPTSRWEKVCHCDSNDDSTMAA